EIFSLAGARLHYQKVSAGYTSMNRFIVNEFGELPPGTYVVRVLTGNSQHVRKVVRSSKPR
ncbi:MAG: T9SS type A sorting domain-containing protein, partial [Bacteroidales bacterium]